MQQSELYALKIDLFPHHVLLLVLLYVEVARCVQLTVAYPGYGPIKVCEG